MTRVRIEDIAKAFGPIWAVRGMTLEIGEGEFFSLLGPSGCGKTTTLRIIAGLERPTRGEIWFGEERVTAVPPQFRNIGLVFQSYAVFPTMTVYDNVAYGLRIRRLPEAEIHRRVFAVLEMVGMEALADRMPGRISGGQMQRVALARALAIRPRILLLDEPLSNLDAKLRVEVRAEIRRLQREVGITTIYVTHDQEEALSLSDRVGVMNHGILEQVAGPDEIYRRPKTRFVAGFVGEGTMLEGVLTGDRGGYRVKLNEHMSLSLVQTLTAASGPVWVCVRPEALRVARSGVSGALVVDGVVEHMEFVGPSIRAGIRVPGLNQPLLISGSSVELAGTFRLGAQLRVEIDPAGIAVGPLSADRDARR